MKKIYIIYKLKQFLNLIEWIQPLDEINKKHFKYIFSILYLKNNFFFYLVFFFLFNFVYSLSLSLFLPK